MIMSTFISFLLDETGSMESVKDDTIGGFNSFVDTLSKDIEGNCYFTLVKFDSSHETVVCEGVEPAEVPRLDNDNYRPGAMTPLIDAIFNIVKKTEELVKGKNMDKNNVLIVVQTDGNENRSRENTKDQLKELITGKEKDGWAFTFIGAGIDAFKEAGQYGFSRGSTMSYSMDSSMDSFDAIAGNALKYANSGLKGSANVAFSAIQRSDSGEASVIGDTPSDPGDPICKVDPTGDGVKAISEVEAALKRAKGKTGENVAT